MKNGRVLKTKALATILIISMFLTLSIDSTASSTLGMNKSSSKTIAPPRADETKVLEAESLNYSKVNLIHNDASNSIGISMPQKNSSISFTIGKPPSNYFLYDLLITVIPDIGTDWEFYCSMNYGPSAYHFTNKSPQEYMDKNITTVRIKNIFASSNSVRIFRKSLSENCPLVDKIELVPVRNIKLEAESNSVKKYNYGFETYLNPIRTWVCMNKTSNFKSSIIFPVTFSGKADLSIRYKSERDRKLSISLSTKRHTTVTLTKTSSSGKDVKIFNAPFKDQNGKIELFTEASSDGGPDIDYIQIDYRKK